MPKLSVELPQTLIDDLDQHKRAYCADLGVPTGIGRVNLITALLYAGIDHTRKSSNAPLTPPEPQPEPPTLTPIIPTADGAELDWETLGTQALTSKAIDRMDTTELLDYIIGETAIGNPQDLRHLAGCSVSHLMRRFDLALEDANRLAMLFEFAKRVARSHAEREKITNPAEVASYLMPHLRYLQHEVMVCMALDTKGFVSDSLMVSEDTNTAESAMGNLISHRVLYEGTLNACVFHPREIYRHAIDCCANSIIVAHNHPSGDPQPSQEDIRATKQLIEAGNHIGIKVLDHIIIGDGIFVSLKEEGFI